jgi:hypothetical protein
MIIEPTECTCPPQELSVDDKGLVLVAGFGMHTVMNENFACQVRPIITPAQSRCTTSVQQNTSHPDPCLILGGQSYRHHPQIPN